MPAVSPGPVQDVEYVSSWFSVELDNGIQGFFTQVSGLSMTLNIAEPTDSNGRTMVRKRPGTVSYSEINLKRTLGPDQSFWKWAKSIRDGKTDYKVNGSVVLHDMGGTEIGRWNFTNAWPSKWSASDLDVGSDDVMEEDVTLQIELLTRES